MSLNLAKVGFQVDEGEIVNLGPLISLKHFLQMWTIISRHVHGTLQLGNALWQTEQDHCEAGVSCWGEEPIKTRERIKRYFRHIPRHSRGRAVRIQNFRENLSIWCFMCGRTVLLCSKSPGFLSGLLEWKSFI